MQRVAEGQPLSCVRVVAGPNDDGALEEFFAALGLTAAVCRDLEAGCTTAEVFEQDPARAQRIAERVRGELDAWGDLFSGPVPTVRTDVLAWEDWTESWKQHFHTFRASRRLVVKPSWETYAALPEDVVLELDPGMCFGTGYHGTTRACLQYLDDLAARLGSVSLLDAGCGSGILSLAGAKLGYAPVVAFDNDPNAATVTRENLAGAGAIDVDVRCADVGSWDGTQRFDVVVANILAPVLIENAAALAEVPVRKRGFLVLSGILTEQYAAVRRCYEDLGLREMDSRTIDEWTSGCFQRTEAP